MWLVRKIEILDHIIRYSSIISPTNARNCYSQMLIEIRLVGLVRFLGILLSLMRNMGKLLTGQEKSKSNFLIILVGLCGGVVAFLLHSFFDTNLYSFQLSLNFWFFIGLILSIHRLLKESPLYGIKAQ